jgi:hypothetical protein
MRGAALALSIKCKLVVSAAKERGKRQHGNKGGIKKQRIPKNLFEFM